MVNINIHIGTTNESESNEFLKCLWAEIAKEFGKCAWQYMPSKQLIKGRISFGHMDIDNDPNNFPSNLVFAVSVSYKERGTIKDIFFDADTKVPNKKEVFERLKKTVNSAKQNIGNYSFFQYSTGIKSMYSLSSYEGERFSIKIDSEKISKLTIRVESYDENQGSGIATKKINQLMDFLSVETNAPFWNTDELDEDVSEEIGKEIYQEDEEFIDGLSYKDGHLVLSREGKDFVEKLVNLENEDDQAMSLFLKACHHFHTARRYHAQLENIYLVNPRKDGDKMTYEIKRHEDLELAASMGDSHTEIATTLYLSALEVITLYNFKQENCETCSQPKFKIKQRVKEFITEHLNEFVAKQIGNYYDKRSFYLHRGSMLTRDMPTGSSIPLLDKNDKTGCVDPVKVSLNNLREFTSYCMRKFYKEKLL
ncbi:hypothetical protein PV770_25935 [Bacillus sp. OR-18]|nr:hypothetical protein [Bacillus sp. OR-18]